MDRRSYLGGLVVLLAACGTPKPDSPTDTPRETGAEDSVPEADDTGDSGPPTPVDGDADGFDTTTDCDDTNASIHPGAVDPCDGIDQDCDGVGYAEASCSEVVDLGVGAGAWEADDVATHVALLSASTDFDGDQIPDLIFSTSCVLVGDVRSCWTGAALVPGGIPDDGTPITTATVGHWAGEPNTDLLANAGAAGDFDGDGSGDLYFTSIGCDGTSQGSVYLVRGPSDRWSKTPTYMGDAADARWLADRPYVCFGEEADAGRDLDGDGMDEIVTWNDYDRVHVLRGRVDPQGTMAAADELWFASDGSPQDAALLPDQDGDGLEDLGFNVEDGDAPMLGWLPEPMGYSAGSLLADVLVTIRSNAGRSFAYAPQGALGDQDTDGHEEVLVWVVVPDSGASPYKTCATWLDGGTPAGGDFTDALGPILCYDNSDGMGAWGDIDPVPDVDGDGQTDILWKREDLGYHHGSCLIPSSRLPPSGHVSIGDVSYCFTGGEEDTPGIDSLADLDGDGLPEFLMNDSHWEGDTGSRYGRVLVAPGFQIPWDDPSAW